MEGTFDELLGIITECRDVCFSKGADELIINIKMQLRRGTDVTIEDKMRKYD